MAWVRYDDQFYGHPKVTAVIAEDPGALALHVLANTWTNGQKRPGYIPLHQPAMLVCDRGLGVKWASVLVHARLWHERGQECDECREEYADLPADATGYVVHNAKHYRAPARERQTPGTPAEISAARAAAGRKGGRTTAARREAAQQNARANDPANVANDAANQANPAVVCDAAVPSLRAVPAAVEDAPDGLFDSDEVGRIEQPARANAANSASKSSKRASNGASPEPEPGPPFASNEAKGSPPVGDAPTSRRSRKSADSKPSNGSGAGAVVGAFYQGAVDAGLDAPSDRLRARVGKDANRLIAAGVDLERLTEAARQMGAAGWCDLDIQLQRMSAERVAAERGRTGTGGNKPYRNFANAAYDGWTEGPRSA